MPALPWVQREPLDPDATYLAMASRLPLKSYSSIPGFVRDAYAIRRQLAGSEGLIGYTLDAKPLRKTFWTFSVWRQREHLDAFVGTLPHGRIMRRLKPLMNESRFEFFSVPAQSLPMSWDQIRAHLG
ncbi:MAG TPA: hypothetical protein VF444_04120 [Pseudonocardiaceae bacterium]